jgi:hypothetical protein
VWPDNRGVGAQHSAGRQAARLQPLSRGGEFGLGHTLHVVGRPLAAASGFECFGVFFRAGQQQFVACADQIEQLPAARALRGQVEQLVVHATGRSAAGRSSITTVCAALSCRPWRFGSHSSCARPMPPVASLHHTQAHQLLAQRLALPPGRQQREIDDAPAQAGADLVEPRHQAFAHTLRSLLGLGECGFEFGDAHRGDGLGGAG